MTKKIANENFNGTDESEKMLDLERASHLIQAIEENLRALKQVISYQNVEVAPSDPNAIPWQTQSPEEEGQSVEGIFDGERMIDSSGKIYQVSANYASKSKLVEGDPLKLYITPDGKYFYKQIGPIERKTMPAVLKMEGSRYILEAEDGVVYNVLTASVTYYMSLYHLQPGDNVMIMVPADKPSRWAVIDNVI